MNNGYIYIMTNPCLQNIVKLGYAKDVEERCKQMDMPNLPFGYKVYAIYETSGDLDDKKLYQLIDKLNPELRIDPKKDFHAMSEEEAFAFLEAIAAITGTEENLIRVDEESVQERSQNSVTQKRDYVRPSVNFAKCNIPVGAELVYIEDPNVKVIVASERKVFYKGKVTSLSAVVEKKKGIKSAQGTAYFTYNGKLITEIAEETQWKDL